MLVRCLLQKRHHSSSLLYRRLMRSSAPLKTLALGSCDMGHAPDYNFASNIVPPSQASPASSLVQLLTEPGSMHRYRFQPSFGSKSPIAASLSIQPFHTVTSGKASLLVIKLSLPSSRMMTGGRGVEGVVYTRSVSDVMGISEDCSVKVFAPCTLST